MCVDLQLLALGAWGALKRIFALKRKSVIVLFLDQFRSPVMGPTRFHSLLLAAEIEAVIAAAIAI